MRTSAQRRRRLSNAYLCAFGLNSRDPRWNSVESIFSRMYALKRGNPLELYSPDVVRYAFQATEAKYSKFGLPELLFEIPWKGADIDQQSREAFVAFTAEYRTTLYWPMPVERRDTIRGILSQWFNG